MSVLFTFYLDTLLKIKLMEHFPPFCMSTMFDNPGIKTIYSAIISQILR